MCNCIYRYQTPLLYNFRAVQIDLSGILNGKCSIYLFIFLNLNSKIFSVFIYLFIFFIGVTGSTQEYFTYMRTASITVGGKQAVPQRKRTTIPRLLEDLPTDTRRRSHNKQIKIRKLKKLNFKARKYDLQEQIIENIPYLCLYSVRGE